MHWGYRCWGERARELRRARETLWEVADEFCELLRD